MASETLCADNASMWRRDLGRWTALMQVQGLSSETIRQYRRTVVNFLADTLIDMYEVSEQDVLDYLSDMDPRGHAKAQTLKALRSLYAALYRWGEVRRNPVAVLTPKRPKYGPAPALEDEEVRRLVLAAAWRDPRRAWTVLLLWATGLRLGSLCALEPRDLRGDVLTVRVAKGDRPYAIALGPVGLTAAQALIAYGHQTIVGAGDGRVWEWIHQAGEDAGLRAHPHLLRHSWATRHIELGTHPRVLQELGNWADLSQLGRYAHVSDPLKRAAQAHF